MTRDFLVHPPTRKVVEWHYDGRPSLADVLAAAKKEFPGKDFSDLKIDVILKPGVPGLKAGGQAVVLTEREDD